MSILRRTAEWFLSASNNRHLKSLKRKKDRAEAAAESLREHYEDNFWRFPENGSRLANITT